MKIEKGSVSPSAFTHFAINNTVRKNVFRMKVNENQNQNINHERYFYWTVSPFYTIKLM